MRSILEAFGGLRYDLQGWLPDHHNVHLCWRILTSRRMTFRLYVVVLLSPVGMREWLCFLRVP